MKQGLITLLFLACFQLNAGVLTSKHNLSTSGPGSIKASSEQQVCIFCHTPHSSAPESPLWNRATPGSTYTPYSSSSIVASPGQPTGASLLCLSCHDGTIAIGDILSQADPITMTGSSRIPQGKTRLGTDLSDDHPVSFVFNNNLATQNGELVSPSNLTGVVKLDKTGQMQCTSCHDPHDDKNGKFLVMQNTASALCKTCHQKQNWNSTAHSTSSSGWNGVNPDPWPTTEESTVASNACENCHTPHNAGGNERILKYSAEEDNCLVCHNGHVASKNIENEFNKFSRHPITDDTGIHQPKESVVVNSRHVECVDCHNPHAANSSNPLEGVKGITQQGNVTNQVNGAHELCYRCHGDSSNKPAQRTNRQFNENNVRAEFDTGQSSYHPIAGTGRNNFVPSLIGPLNTSSKISCLDCHNNNDTNGPNGPHGSVYEPLLERQYLTQDPTSESSSAYSLCYKCHDRSSILSNESFPRHSFHINGGGGMGGMGGMSNLNTPCNVCHDPHGSQQPKLINFDRDVVSPSSSGELRHFSNSSGAGSGGCYLTCHGRNHNPCNYDSASGTANCGMMGGGGGGGGGGGH